MPKHYGNKMGKNRVASPSSQKGEYSHEYANMPSEKVMREYPRADYNGPEDYNDTREGIDMLSSNNHKKMMQHRGGRYGGK